jgi:hypothetical protein
MKKTMLLAYPYQVEVTNAQGKVEKIQEFSYEPLEGVKPVKVAYYGPNPRTKKLNTVVVRNTDG